VLFHIRIQGKQNAHSIVKPITSKVKNTLMVQPFFLCSDDHIPHWLVKPGVESIPNENFEEF